MHYAIKRPYFPAGLCLVSQLPLCRNGSDIITGINEIHKVVNGDLTFVDFAKYYDKALKSAATFIIINKEVDVPEGKGLLFSDDPFRDYVKLVKHFHHLIPR